MRSLYKSIAQFNAVCPPKVHKIPVGRSFFIISATNSFVIGKK